MSELYREGKIVHMSTSDSMIDELPLTQVSSSSDHHSTNVMEFIKRATEIPYVMLINFVLIYK
jgi:hypothetical protein